MIFISFHNSVVLSLIVFSERKQNFFFHHFPFSIFNFPFYIFTFISFPTIDTNEWMNELVNAINIWMNEWIKRKNHSPYHDIINLYIYISMSQCHSQIISKKNKNKKMCVNVKWMMVCHCMLDWCIVHHHFEYFILFRSLLKIWGSARLV